MCPFVGVCKLGWCVRNCALGSHKRDSVGTGEGEEDGEGPGDMEEVEAGEAGAASVDFLLRLL